MWLNLEKCCSFQRQFPESVENDRIVDSGVASPAGEQLGIAAAQSPDDSLRRRRRESAPPTIGAGHALYQGICGVDVSSELIGQLRHSPRFLQTSHCPSNADGPRVVVP